MVAYRAVFYREIFGVPFRVRRGQVDIQAARDVSRATAAAKLRFARRLGVEDWEFCADRLEIEAAQG